MARESLICVSIAAASNEEMLAEMVRLAPEADLLELRIDGIPAPDLKRLLANRPRPVIVTNRPARECGAYQGPEDKRVALLQDAVNLGAEYVDVELDSADRIQRRGATKLIVSYHNFDVTPANLEAIYSSITQSNADIVKVAVMANDIRDNLRVFDLMRSAVIPTIGICMGEIGRISRILAPKFRGHLMFAAVAQGRESGPGQLTAAELRDIYRFDRIGPETAIYGLIADPVGHSLSPHIHNAAFDALGMDAVYVPFKVEGDPGSFVRDFQALDVRGYSVTIPHKQAIMDAMDEVEPLALRIGAMNTIVVRDGRLFGSNTDYSGALDALERALGGAEPLRGKRVAILGAGGAARALAFGAQDRGALVTICNRTHERGVRLAEDIGCAARPLAEFGGLSPAPEILINTTRVGMWPEVDAVIVPPSEIKPEMFVYDAVYNPVETRLIREAAAIGCRTLGGVDWFIGQGVAQFELWTGRPAPRDVMRRAMLQALESRSPE